jgi:hypothetical protein
MIGLIIGSTAIKHWFPDFPRQPGDLDLWSPDLDEQSTALLKERFGASKIDNFWDDRLRDTVVPSWGIQSSTGIVNTPYAFPDELYTMKVSHSSWELDNGSWRKHMHDVVWLKQHGATLLPELWRILYDIWSDLHGAKRVNLNQESSKFFKDAVVRIYDHDSIHDTVAHYHRPLWMEVLKDGAEVGMDMKKVWDLPFADQIRLFREEVYATALERWMIPANYEFSPSLAYARALRKTIVSLTKGVSSRFMIENYDLFRTMPKTLDGKSWYMVNHMATRHLLKPLES